MTSTALLIVYWCVSVVSFPLPTPLKKSNHLTLREQLLNRSRLTCSTDPYNLGLTPYIQKAPLSEKQEIEDKPVPHYDSNETLRVNRTTQEPLSYLHLLRNPDSLQTSVAHNETRPRKKQPRSLFIDDWMMQLPSKWVAFMSEGDKHDINSISNMFAIPPSTAPNVNLRITNDKATNRTETFNTSTDNDFDAIWAAKNYTLQKQAEKVQNKTKIVRLSTQPQSIFTNNFNDLRKNTTTSTPLHVHPLLAGKDPTATITVADLEAVLRYNDYYSKPSALSTKQEPGGGKANVAVASPKASKGSVAFPQPTTLSNASMKWGATISGGFMGMLLAVSGSPNLWLVGSLAGSVFGFETGRRLSSDGSLNDLNFVQSVVVYLGRYLATQALKVYDAFQTFFFMYKTGQLSYEYYKSYAVLDKRLSIQKKIDAWNARFVEGKLAFDRWEKENEVGRKVLAGLRTAWLVGEQNIRKRSGLLRRSQRYQSRYRVIQFAYDAIYTIGTLCQSFWKSIVRGDLSSEIRNFARGVIRNDMGNLNFTQAHVRGVILSVVILFIIGALFTISPALLFVFAATFGFIWPTWFSDMMDRTGIIFGEITARGSGKVSIRKRKEESPPFQRYLKNRYHYYRTTEGKKRYYRVGEPWIIFGQFKQRKLPPTKSGPFAWMLNND